MYLSQPRDLMTSMSAGCSRSTTLLHSTDNLAQLPLFRGEDSFDHRRTVDLEQFQIQPPSERHYNRMQDLCPARFVHSTGLVSTEPYSGAMSISGSMSRLFRSQHFQEVWDKLDPGTAEARPPHPYTELIKLCILKRREGKLTLNQLYHDLEAKFPHFAASPKGAGWKNTLRHNLSTQPYFIKLEREHGQLGKGHYWAYCPDLEKPTSLAQSSIVQLSSLWPPSVSAASISPGEEASNAFSSTTEFQHGHVSHRPQSGVSSLPRYRDPIDSQDSREVTRSHRRPVHEYHRDENPPSASANIYARRRSSPGRRLRPLEDRDTISSSSGFTRLRSATINSLSRPSAAAALAPLPPSSPANNRRGSGSWRASSPSPMPLFADDVEHLSDVPRRPSLADLPAAPARSLSDWYLNNPISRRKSSVGSAGSGGRSRFEPYPS